MESTIVIKVKYGDTLRRFNARVVDQELALDLDGLREKVLSLFNFPSDSEIKLTYIDEDGDVVTLADEEDLHDVMRQSLNPLRISVKLNTESIRGSQSRSSGNSTPLRSPGVQPSLQNLNSSVSEILKSVPEAIRETLSRLSTELGSNTTPSPPGYSELLDSFSKLGLTYLKEVSTSSTKSEPSESNMDAPMTEDKSSSKVDGITPIADLKSNEANTGNLTGNSEGFASLSAGLVDLNASIHGDKPAIGVDLNAALHGGEPSIVSSFADPAPSSFDVTGNNKKDKFKKSNKSRLGWKSDGVGTSIPHNNMNPGTLSSLASFTGTKVAAADSGSSLGSQFSLNAFNECPFAGVPIENYSSSVPGRPYAPRAVPIKRSYNHSDGIGSKFHRGVRCDGCGVHPITGPRFKSKVKEDYDLCSICFADMGNEADYIRMDRPMSYRHPVSLKDFFDPMQQYRLRPPTLPQVLRGSGSRSKLDSRFIQDISILDGTFMAPSTPFTKIWRMRNNGNVVWPRGTQLLWIGGDRFSKTLSSELEIPADGFHVDKEIDIALDFIAPEHPGRYISHWRMASPSGQKFGQRVWVLIQVNASSNDSFSENVHGFNLNLPPFNGGIAENVSFEPMVEESLTQPVKSNRATELLEPVVDAPSDNDQEHNFPINDNLLVGGAVSNPAPLESSTPVTYPIIDSSEVAPITTTPAQNSNADASSSVENVVGNYEVEQTLLKELEEMGFKQVDLNKEILRMNYFNLEQSVDDLCGVSEWDPILDELQEMGFSDQKMNKMLLKKNNGSIKRVVMDLIAAEME